MRQGDNMDDTTPEKFKGVILYSCSSGRYHARLAEGKNNMGDYAFRDSSYRPINWGSKAEAKAFIDGATRG